MERVSDVGRRARGARAGGTAGGFTLVELLVVVGIIALLVTILGPTLSVALELARRSKCATNLHGIGRGLTLYHTAHGTYPYVPTNGAGWGVAIGTSRGIDPAGAAANPRSPSSCLYELVRLKRCPAAMFVCPSSREADKPEAGTYWDFPDGTTVSYALMDPYGPERRFDAAAAGDMPIMADSSPYFDPKTGRRNDAPVVDLAGADNDAARDGNSPNHDRDGQNVAVVGGSTAWRERADVGCDLDNIYTRAGDDGTDRKGSLPDPGPDADAPDQGPAGRYDSYLVQ